MSADVAFKVEGLIKFITGDADNKSGVIVTTQFEGFSSTVKLKEDHMAYNLPDGKKVTVQVAYVDAKGNPAKVDGDVAWSSSGNGIAMVTADATDTTKAVIQSSSLGQAQITAKADADLGAGVRELLTMFDVEVVAGEAVAGTIAPVGPPE
jgi:hypothetical protein